MRILKTAVLAILAAVFATGTVFAGELITYQLKDLDLSIGMPAGFYTFTRDLQEDAPVFAETGITKEEMDSLLESEGYYLGAFDAANTTEILVRKADNIPVDINQLSNEELTLLADSFQTRSAEVGVPLGKPVIYNHKQTKFIQYGLQMHTTLEDSVYQLCYSTFFNGQGITVFLRSYTGGLEDTQEELLKKVVDSVYFESELSPARTEPLSSETQLEVLGKTDLTSYKKKTTSKVYYMVEILFASAAIGCLIFVLVGRKKQKKENQKNDASFKAYMKEKKEAETGGNADDPKDGANGVDGKDALPPDKPAVCPKCGAELVKAQRFCPKCGERLL